VSQPMRFWPLLLLVTACEQGPPQMEAQTTGGMVPLPRADSAESCDEAPGPGCPCSEEGARIACHEVHAMVAGQAVCGQGEAVCTHGTYGECAINHAVTLSQLQSKSLGGPSDCASPCDPGCQQFVDEPDTDLTDDDAGVVADDGGVSLPGAPGLSESACSGGTSGTCSHSVCETGAPLSPGCDATAPNEPSCVTAVCNEDPSCCNGSWSSACTDRLEATCGVSCYADEGGACFACYQDSFDHDGDGYTGIDGDCLDCDPLVNAGAYDFPNNGLDENCDGTADNETVACDGSIPLATSDPYQFAQAIDLCRQASPGATGALRTWGVLDAALVQATGTDSPMSRQYAVQSAFGATNAPQGGSKMAAFSTGTARTPGQAGYRNPNGQVDSYVAGSACTYPSGFPKNAAGCPSTGAAAFDSSGLKLRIRVPTNAKSFSYNFNYFSTEYPEWVCTAYNDHFVALLTGSSALPANPPQNRNNISFDANGDPVSVNVAFFTEPGCSNCSSAVLGNTGFGGLCWNESCGGATDWLYTTAPVVGGEEITLQFATWDQGDALWDSTVLVDNFQWSVESTGIKTGVEPPKPPPTLYNEGTFIRDYDATGLCPAGQSIRWGHWSWTGKTPSDSHIAFYVRVADSQASLDTAPEQPLLFSNPPAALAGTSAIAQQGMPDTQNGSLIVDETLVGEGMNRHSNFVRIVSRLRPSTDLLFAPTLTAWNLQITCVDDV